MRAWVLVLVAFVGVMSACGDDSASDLGDDGERYAVLSDDAWSLQEAVDPPENDPLVVDRPPLLDWWAEYVWASPEEGRMVRLSGHQLPLAEARADLAGLGFALDDVAVDGWTAVGGTSVDDPSGPAIVLLDRGSTSLMLLSYELTVADLAALAGQTRAVDDLGWVSAGGIVR